MAERTHKAIGNLRTRMYLPTPKQVEKALTTWQLNVGSKPPTHEQHMKSTLSRCCGNRDNVQKPYAEMFLVCLQKCLVLTEIFVALLQITHCCCCCNCLSVSDSLFPPPVAPPSYCLPHPSCPSSKSNLICTSKINKLLE